MRIHLLAFILLASAAAPAAAQSERIDRRVDRLEQQIQAVQRRVFPNGGTGQYVQPEITQESGPAVQPGIPASSAVADLSARVDALESQLSTLTGQAEENSHRLRQLEESFQRLERETQARLTAAETRPAPAAPTPDADSPPPAEDAATSEPAATPPTGDSAEAAYNAGFRLWEQQRYDEAQQALQAVAQRYPNSRWASWARNLAGRASLDAGKPATAANILLENYQTNPRGERAADSLYFLGQALVRLDRRPEACRAYAELQEVYGSNLRDYLRQRLPAALSEARCTE